MKGINSVSNPIPEGILYLDYAATTPLAPEVLAEMMPYLTEAFGNAATIYSLGAQCRDAVEKARERVATLLGAEDPAEIVFTSGGTEADNTAIRGVYSLHPKSSIVCSSFEHHAVLDTCRAVAGDKCQVVDVDEDGLLRPEALKRAMPPDTCLVSIMHSNNEIGTIQPIRELAEVAHEAGALFHTDAVQSVGKVPIDVVDLGVDLLSLSAHKLYGPKGVGALFVRRRPRVRLLPLFSGGGQERGLRSGTLPAPLIVGFGEAARLAAAEGRLDEGRAAQQRARLLARLSAAVPGLRENAAKAPRIAANLSITFPGGADAQAIMAAAPGLCVSTGSACSSASVEPSYVLRALGMPDSEARATLRIGIGRFTSPRDIDTAADLLAEAWRRTVSSAVEQVSAE